MTTLERDKFLPDKSGLISNKTLNDKYQISSNLKNQNTNTIKLQITNLKEQINSKITNLKEQINHKFQINFISSTQMKSK